MPGDPEDIIHWKTVKMRAQALLAEDVLKVKRKETVPFADYLDDEKQRYNMTKQALLRIPLSFPDAELQELLICQISER